MFRKKGKRKAILYGLLIVFAATFIGGAVRQLSLLPDEIYLIGNHSRTLDVGLPMSMTLKDALNEKNNPEITVNGTLVSEELNLGSALEIASSEEGSAEVQNRLLKKMQNIRVFRWKIQKKAP